MAEYIDREETKEWIAAWLKENKYWHPYSKGKNIPTAVMFDMLTIIPAADVQPVKHGRWVSIGHKLSRICSVCDCDEPYKFADDDANVYDYCPHCGAKMDGEI